MIERLASGWTVPAVAAALGVDGKTVRKWRARHVAEGDAGLLDRSSRPQASPTRLAEAAEAAIVILRQERLSGPAIARRPGRPVSTVSLVLRRLGLPRLPPLAPRPPIVRYEREQPGELIHVDIKKLGRIRGVGHRITGERNGQGRNRGIGPPGPPGPGRFAKGSAACRGRWEHLHVAVDDRSRRAYTELLPDETKGSACAFLKRALAWFHGLGVTVERVMTDNRPPRGRSVTAGACAARRTRGSAYKSHAFRDALAATGVKHKRTRPYTPRTNGPRPAMAGRAGGDGSSALRSMAERFIQTSLREWAYASPYETSAERANAMPGWLCNHNSCRPHAALKGKPPTSRLPKDNLPGNDS